MKKQSIALLWKLVGNTTVQIQTGRGGGDCGYEFTIGSDYLVYASHAYGKPNAYLVTSICSRTTELSQAAEDMAYLNTLPTLGLKKSSNMGFVLLCGFGLIAVILALFVIYFRRCKKSAQ